MQAMQDNSERRVENVDKAKTIHLEMHMDLIAENGLTHK